MKTIARAFTFVELIVSITILVILSSIGFYSYVGYLGTVRDGKRITEINNIKSAIESYQIKHKFYPKPDNSLDITYSGATVWTQGIVGEGISKKIGYTKEKILDPKSENYYTYSIKNTRNEYSLAGVLEDDDSIVYDNNLLYKTYADGTIKGYAMVVGNYNGIVTHVKTGAVDYVLALPSIISSDLNYTNLIDLLDNKKLVYNGYNNLPESYRGSDFIIDNGTDFKANNLVIFSGYISDLQTLGTRINLLYSLQQAYLGKDFAQDVEFLKSVLDEEIDLVTPSNETKSLACDLLKYKLSYNVDCN